MSDQIELHDSRVVLTVADDTVVVHLCPAYVHHWDRSSSGWHGEGRSQSAEIVILGGKVTATPGEGAFEVSDGWVEVGARLYDNLIPAPFEDHMPVRLRLRLVNGGPIDLLGRGVTVRLMGEPEYVEDLPVEWAPEPSTG